MLDRVITCPKFKGLLVHGLPKEVAYVLDVDQLIHQCMYVHKSARYYEYNCLFN